MINDGSERQCHAPGLPSDTCKAAAGLTRNLRIECDETWLPTLKPLKNLHLKQVQKRPVLTVAAKQYRNTVQLAAVTAVPQN
jgi:hypothetical protein